MDKSKIEGHIYFNFPKTEHFILEKEANELGFVYLAGVDEAGRGACAGPLVAATVILPPNSHIDVSDSKKLSPSKREQLYIEIIKEALAYDIQFISAKEINELGIAYANKEAMFRSILEVEKKLKEKHKLSLEGVISDFVDLPNLKNHFSHQNFYFIHPKKADANSYNVAAASILAKVARDNYMKKLDELYPQYFFSQHKGYGTALHKDSIKKNDVCVEHRLKFVETLLKK